jgi:RNA polymerase sigma-70 factor (ECF subfamily)
MSGDSLPLILPASGARRAAPEATTLFQELRKPLLRYLVCLGLTSDEAQDVVQDAFLGLHQHLSGGGGAENVRSWLFRVAHNQARNRQKSHERRYSAPLSPEAEAMSDHATPERLFLKKEKLRNVEAAIRSLTESERDCLLLRSEGLRYREIGEVLALPTSTVADTVERAIKKLAEKCNV